VQRPRDHRSGARVGYAAGAQVLELVADGLPAKSIADRLGIAVSTVRNHIRAILVELGCQQLEAAAQARRRGLIR
jgi:DNA-binding NarL/FixJ family response regulator